MRRAFDVTPTRINLIRTRRRLARVREGADLLRKKREALVRELFRHARPAIDARDRIDRCATDAYGLLLDALAEEGLDGAEVTAAPSRERLLSMSQTRTWGVRVTSVAETPRLRRTLEARGTVPSLAAPSGADTAAAFETLAELLLDAAPRETLLHTLGRTVARTSRQVRALERRVEPGLASASARISGLLEEREREDQARLRHFLTVQQGPIP